MSAQQMIDLAFVIFAKQPILHCNLRLWNCRPLAERTWDNMLEHFRDTQADLSSLPTAGDIYHLQPPIKLMRSSQWLTSSLNVFLTPCPLLPTLLLHLLR
jgi:hypothetical protein